MTLRSDHPMSARAYHELDISSSAFWARTFGERELTCARLRRDSQRDGLTWHEPFPANFPHAETGFWAATRHEDIGYISKHHELFSSAEGVGVSPLPKQAQAAVSFFLMMAPPQHSVRPVQRLHPVPLPQSPCRLRRRRCPLLPGQQCGENAVAGAVPRTAYPAA